VAEPVCFYFDEHIASVVTRGLRQRGVDVLTINEAGRGGMAEYSPGQLLELLRVLHGVMDREEMRNHVEFL
jgi:hypothetical protein